MTYIIYPVIDGRVIDGPCIAAHYSAESQDEARDLCLERNPTATGTARAHATDEIEVGAVAGSDLEIERPR